MRVSDFDFDLPPERIALRPARPRDAARLLVVKPDSLEDKRIGDLPNLLGAGDVLVFNDTKVVPAALSGRRIGRDEAEPHISVTLLTRLNPFSWRAFAKPGKRLREGDRIRFGAEGRVCLLGVLDATVAEKGGDGQVVLVFDFHGAVLDEAVASLGDMPLPPYIASKRPADDTDRADYQTVYAKEEGAVAAPTAGLHFTANLLADLASHGIGRDFVTLHVGAGTFLPVKSEDTENHQMHPEWGEINAEVAGRLNAARERGGRIVAVGTTSLRLLESATRRGRIEPFLGFTDIFITPGYEFKAVDLLITNFHLPRSTLFMLTAAFAGLERMREAYAHAIAHEYRFYSYGDASLIFPRAR